MKRLHFISQLGCIGVSAFGFKNLDFISPSEDVEKYTKVFLNKKEDSVMISVKVIKEKEQFCSSPPEIRFSSDGWFFNPQLDTNGDFYGENLREVYFNIQSRANNFSTTKVKISLSGMNAARVIIGHTDVPFQQLGNEVQFTLIDDRSRGQLMELMYQNPWGGYPIAFIHNWEIRKAKEYALQPFPAKKFASIPNYLLAAQEVFRQMSNMGPGLSKPFKGEIVLQGSEVAATRGHVDYPPHFHIMHYEFDKDLNGEKQWKSRLVPHFYMDEMGNIVRNKYEVIVGKGDRSKDIDPGESVRFEDAEGRHIMDIVIDNGGLLFLLPDGRRYSILPDKDEGASGAVWGYFNDKVVCRARVKDYPSIGTFRICLEKIDQGKVLKVLNEGYLYDPFTAHRLSRLYSSSSF